jgi:hypothetical protein
MAMPSDFSFLTLPTCQTVTCSFLNSPSVSLSFSTFSESELNDFVAQYLDSPLISYYVSFPGRGHALVTWNYPPLNIGATTFPKHVCPQETSAK